MYIIIIWIRSKGQNSDPGTEPEMEFMDLNFDKRRVFCSVLFTASSTGGF
jgi:hypothetical protein